MISILPLCGSNCRYIFASFLLEDTFSSNYYYFRLKLIVQLCNPSWGLAPHVYNQLINSIILSTCVRWYKANTRLSVSLAWSTSSIKSVSFFRVKGGWNALLDTILNKFMFLFIFFFMCCRLWKSVLLCCVTCVQLFVCIMMMLCMLSSPFVILTTSFYFCSSPVRNLTFLYIASFHTSS